MAAGERLRRSRHDRSDRCLQSARQFLGDQVAPAGLVRPRRSDQQSDMPGQHLPEALERDHRADRVLVAVEARLPEHTASIGASSVAP
jgi:hypothetical protein